MTKNIENWTYKSKAELEVLDDKTLIQLDKSLTSSLKAFRTAMIPPTDEMVWLLMVLPQVMSERNLI